MDLPALLAAHGFGMPADGVTLVAPVPAWAAGGAALVAALPGPADWHHVGSTAVPGLPAKPIVDVVGAVPVGVPLDTLEGPLVSLGFLWLGEYGIPGRRFARLRAAGPAAEWFDYAHLHLFAADTPRVRAMIGFRDGLRRDPAARDAYAALKAASAAAFAADRDAYTESKSTFISDRLHDFGTPLPR